MDGNEELRLYDCLMSAMATFSGVEQALGHVSDVSTDYELCQMLSGVMHAEIQKVGNAFPDVWKKEIEVC